MPLHSNFPERFFFPFWIRVHVEIFRWNELKRETRSPMWRKETAWATGRAATLFVYITKQFAPSERGQRHFSMIHYRYTYVQCVCALVFVFVCVLFKLYSFIFFARFSVAGFVQSFHVLNMHERSSCSFAAFRWPPMSFFGRIYTSIQRAFRVVRTTFGKSDW